MRAPSGPYTNNACLIRAGSSHAIGTLPPINVIR